MCALGHYLESNGIATVVIGLIPQHVERIKPPRALLVPFELGRPMGPPNEVTFQQRVLRAALSLAERAGPGPISEWFPDDAPAGIASGPWACPVSFVAPADMRPAAAVRAEIAALQPWYEQGVRARGSSAFGASGLDTNAIVDLLDAIATGTATNDGGGSSGNDAVVGEHAQVPLAQQLKLAADDLRTWYLHALTAKPGADSASVNTWLWQKSEAGKLLQNVKRACIAGGNPALGMVAKFMLAP